MLFKLSNLNLHLALTLGYLNPALNNSAQVFMFIHVEKLKTKCILVKQICSLCRSSNGKYQWSSLPSQCICSYRKLLYDHYHGYFSIGQFYSPRKQPTFPEPTTGFPRGVLTWRWGDFCTGVSSLQFPLVALYLFTWYHHKMSAGASHTEVSSPQFY